MKSSQFGAFLLLIVVLGGLETVFTHPSTSSNCPYEPLPNSFNTIGYLDFNQEFHIHGEYLVDFKKFSQAIPFNLTTKTSCRFTVAPHNVDIDLWIYSDKGQSLHSSLAVGTEEVIFADLEAGLYRLRLVYLALQSQIEPGTCTTVTLEVAMVPTSVLESRVSTFKCPSKSSIPPPSIGNQITEVLSTENEYHASAEFDIVYQASTNPIEWHGSTKFTIPPNDGNLLYRLEATIGYDFITGSSLGLMVQSGSDPARLDPTKCSTTEGCWTGSNYRYNQHVLMTNLPSGNYTIWLFEIINERSPHLACNPFSLSFDIAMVPEDETLLNCKFLPPPLSLNDPGFLDHAGNLFFYENILIDKNLQQMKVQVKTDSAIRVYVSHSSLDVDIYLANSTLDVVESALRYGDDGMTTTLKAGEQYTLSISVSGFFQDSFCDSYTLEVAISPSSSVSLYNSKCSQENKSPDLSGISQGITGIYHLEEGPIYSFSYGGDPSPRIGGIYNATFVVLQPGTLFLVDLDFNFLWGDITMSLVESNGNVLEDSLTRLNRNFLEFGAILNNGTYTLKINFTPVQTDTPPLSQCGLYTLMVFAATSDFWDMGNNTCDYSSAHFLPETLDSVEFFGTSNWIHFQEDFFLPEFTTSFTEEDIIFTPPKDSFLRIFLQVPSVQIEVYLYNTTSLVSENTAETFGKVVEKLKGGEEYTLVFRYYKPEFETECLTYNLELAIEPVEENQSDCDQTSSQLPKPEEIPISGGYMSKTYYFDQTTQEYLNHSIPLQFDKEKVLAVMLNYNFLLSDLFLEMTDTNGDTMGYGINGYNSNFLSSTIIPAGSYILYITETVRSPEEIQGCISFLFSIEILDHKTRYSEEELSLECKMGPLPDSLNYPAYLHNISGQIVHFSQPVIANLGNTDVTTFKIITPSLFRLHVPKITYVDVDLTLWGSGELPIDFRISSGEETIWLELEPDSYRLEISSYSGVQTNMECLSFPLQLAIEPLTYVQGINSVVTSCTTSPDIPTQLKGNTTFHGEYNFTFAGNQSGFRKTLTFQISERGHLDIDLGFDFATAGLSALLSGTSSVGVSYEWAGAVGVNHIFIGENLEPGNYSLSIYTPPTNTPPVNSIKCGQFSIDYFLNVTSSDAPQCEYLPFPSDLYSADGGSQPYGGPQDPQDSSIRLFSKQFLVPMVDRSSYFLTFKINTPSYTRFFSYSPSSDIDFFIYSDVNRTKILGTSLSFDSSESRLFSLDPQEPEFLFELRFATVSGLGCELFHFEMAIEPRETVNETILCPVPLPVPQVPPNNITIPGGLYELYSQDYVITKERLSNSSYTYEYYMDLQVTNVPAQFYAEIGYDFIPNNFELFLIAPKTPDGDSPHFQGSYDGTEDRTENYNFINFLSLTLLRSGTYRLAISENLWSQNSLFANLENYCHHFRFLISVSSEPSPNVTTPEVIRIVPSQGVNLDPTDELRITIFFNTKVASPTATEISDVNGNYSYLVDTVTGFKIPPSNIHFGYQYESLVIVYTEDSLSLSKSYRLVFYPEKFHDANGNAFVLNETSEHIYTTESCDCGGHGTCVSSSGKIACSCNKEYTGSQCQYCVEGYHGLGSDCVQDVPCVDGYCNGHGKCSQVAGVPHCDCDLGWATTGDEYCSICSYGYVSKDGDCVLDEGEEDRPTHCTAPLLPKSLDSPAYLSYNQSIELSGFYFIDVPHRKEDIEFSLKKDSLLRVYIEPHLIDIDLWLATIDSQGRVKNIAHELNLGGEESMFLYLQGSSVKPLKYRLTLRYYIWGTIVPDPCETVNIQLSISTVDVVKTNEFNAQKLCSSVGSYPDLPKNKSLDQTYVYNSPQPHLQPASCPVSTEGQTTDPCQEKRYFYAWNFTVKGEEHKIPVILASIEYHFLPSDLGIAIEVGQGMTCPTKYDANNCFYGQNLYNKNELKMELEPGLYTLYIYQPKAQMINVTKCSLFTLSLTFGYLTVEEDLWDCHANLFPETFNSPGYLDSEGFMHLQDTYFFGDEVSLNFKLETESLFRISMYTERIFYIWALSNDTYVFWFRYSKTQENGYSKNSMAVVLPSGSYNLLLLPQTNTQNIDGEIYCPTTSVEMAIQPMNTYRRTCPTDNKDILPSLPELIQPPFYYHSENLLLFQNNKDELVFASYQLRVRELTSLQVYLTSDFIEGDLSLQLLNEDDSRISTGLTRYNENAFETILEPGNYTLSISQAAYWVQGTSNCVPFSFHLELNETINPYECSQELLSEYPEPLPQTLNTVRFLKSSTKIHYAGSFWIPEIDTYTSQNITLTPSVDSLIRVFIEPHEIDIDMKLVELSSGEKVAEGTNGWNTEEEFVSTIDANTTYVLTFIYFDWFESQTPCLAFDVEFAIQPIASTTLDPDCPQAGQDHWPTSIPQNPAVPFVYDSLALNESLYYQQSKTLTKGKEYTLVLNQTTDLYSSLTFDFLTSHLSLQLKINTEEQPEDGEEVYYAAETYLDRSVLALRGLKPGTYVLSIVEIYTNEIELSGCSFFSMYLYLQAYGYDNGYDSSILNPVLPSTLDSMSYLEFSDRTHLQEPYTVFHGQSQEVVRGTIQTESIVRIYADNPYVEDPEVKYVLAVLKFGDQYYSNPGSLVQKVPAGPIQIMFQLVYNGSWSGNLDKDQILNAEIAIAPTQTLSDDIALWPRSCSVSVLKDIHLNPDGFYQDSKTLTGQAVVGSKSSTIQQLSIELPQETLVYVNVEYNFLLYDIDLQLTNEQGLIVVGVTHKNSEEIHVTVPSGNYTLSLLYSSSESLEYLGNFCFDYLYSIQLQKPDGQHQNCIQNNLIPWDLNDPNGGSEPYGGPLNDRGQLYMDGSSFAMVNQKLQDFINFTLKYPSVVSVWTGVNLGSSYLPFDISIGELLPLSQKKSRLESWEVYHIKDVVSNSGKNAIGLDRVVSTDRQSCPSFSMSIAIETTDTIERLLLCPQSIYSRLPSSVASITNGIGIEHIESIIPEGYTFSNVSIKLDQPSLLFASMEFNPLFYDIQLDLYHLDPSGGSIKVRTGTYIQSEDDTSGSLTHLTYQLSQVSLLTGNYTLAISTSSFVSNIYGSDWQDKTFQGRQVCYPFVWDLQILPLWDAPYIVEIEPNDASKLYFSNERTFEISLRLTTPAYTKDMVAITSLTPSFIQQAFYLSGSGPSLYPIKVESDEDGLDWKLMWSVSSFRSGVTYTLKLTPSRLYNASEFEFILPGIHTYSTPDTTCNGHGKFSDGTCVCYEGYTGQDCNICDLGYESQKTSDGRYVHCSPIGSVDLCQPDSCGCLNVGSGSECLIIGTCDDSLGKVHCTCPSQYAGEHCEKCASGYSGYPRCVPNNKCPSSCGHGECKVTTGTCSCFNGWDGSACDHCADGFSGSDCSVYEPEEPNDSNSSWDSTVKGMIIAGVVILVLITLGFAGFYFYKRRSNPSRYQMMNRDIFDDDLETHPLDDFNPRA